MSKSVMRRLASQKELKSKCCGAPVKVKTSWYIYPDITNNYYVCEKCGEPTSPSEPSEHLP